MYEFSGSPELQNNFILSHYIINYSQNPLKYLYPSSGEHLSITNTNASSHQPIK
jgi:hypothetical protein